MPFTYAAEDLNRRNRTEWVQVPAGLTFGELLAWAKENNISDESTMSAVFHFKAIRPETDEELAARIEWMTKREADHVRWVKTRAAEIAAEEGQGDG